MLSNDNDLCLLYQFDAGWFGSRLTLYRELALGRAPILIETALKVNRFAHLSVLCPKQMALWEVIPVFYTGGLFTGTGTRYSPGISTGNITCIRYWSATMTENR